MYFEWDRERRKDYQGWLLAAQTEPTGVITDAYKVKEMPSLS